MCENLFECLTEDDMMEHFNMAHPQSAMCYEEIESEEVVHDLTTEEPNPYPVEQPKKKYQEAPPAVGDFGSPALTKKIPYPPYSPDYFYYPKEDVYACESCSFTGTATEMFQHLYQCHKGDFEGWVKHYLKAKIIERHLGHSKTESLEDSQLERWVQNDFDQLMMESELTKDANDETLGQWFNARDEKLLSFLTGKENHCVICGLQTQVALMPTDQERYIQKRILDALKANNETLKDLKTLKEVYACTSPALWNKKEVLLNLGCNLHMAIRHKETYRDLVHNNILRGSMPDTFANWNAEPSHEILTGFQIIAVRDRLSKDIQAYRDWLLKSKKK